MADKVFKFKMDDVVKLTDEFCIQYEYLSGQAFIVMELPTELRPTYRVKNIAGGSTQYYFYEDNMLINEPLSGLGRIGIFN